MKTRPPVDFPFSALVLAAIPTIALWAFIIYAWKALWAVVGAMM